MKKSIIVITMCLIITLSLSSCNDKMKVDKEFTGEGEYFNISLTIKGELQAELNDSEINEYKSEGTYELELEYKGNEDDLKGLSSFAIYYPGDLWESGITSEGFIQSKQIKKMFNEKGNLDEYKLKYFNYDIDYFITIEWNGEVCGKETIKLNLDF